MKDFIAKAKLAFASNPTAAATDDSTEGEKVVHITLNSGPYLFKGPLNPTVLAAHTNDNPYSEWRKHPSWHRCMAPRLLVCLLHGKFRICDLNRLFVCRSAEFPPKFP